MARVVLGINADGALSAGPLLSAAESEAEQLAAVRVAQCVARIRAALRVLALPESHVRCTWDTSAGWARMRVQAFDGRRVVRIVQGEGLGGLEKLSHEVLQSVKASRVKGIRAQAIVFHSWAADDAPTEAGGALPVGPSNVIEGLR